MLAIRAAKTKSASTSARQTSRTDASSGRPDNKEAFAAVAVSAAGLRMLRYPGNSKGPGMTEAFANTQPSLISARC
jgi:hypothetical protein